MLNHFPSPPPRQHSTGNRVLKRSRVLETSETCTFNPSLIPVISISFGHTLCSYKEMRASFARETLVTYIHTFARLQLGKQDDKMSEEGELILTDNPFLVFSVHPFK